MLKLIRPLNADCKVEVYRNLHKKCYSIRQNKLVIAYSDNFYISDVILKVSEKGRLRVLKEKRKNVHAILEGYIVEVYNVQLIKKLYYNPYKTSTFIDFDTKIPVYNAKLIHCLPDMTLSYI
jgi:hypothetical protein